jgi:hypothetical protein
VTGKGVNSLCDRIITTAGQGISSFYDVLQVCHLISRRFSYDSDSLHAFIENTILNDVDNKMVRGILLIEHNSSRYQLCSSVRNSMTVYGRRTSASCRLLKAKDSNAGWSGYVRKRGKCSMFSKIRWISTWDSRLWRQPVFKPRIIQVWRQNQVKSTFMWQDHLPNHLFISHHQLSRRGPHR